MAETGTAKEPFLFYTRMHLTELTGLRASTLGQLLKLVKEVNGSCIYHHTHRFLQQHQYLSPEPPNDFAYWVTEVLGEDELGERLASIDVVQFSTIRSLRDKIAATIESYLAKNPMAKVRFSGENEEFHFMKSISFVIPTKYTAHDLGEFADMLGKVTIDSIYYHIFEARLRLEKDTNDFSNWIRTSIGDERIAREISQLDPYTFTLEGLRSRMVRIINSRSSY
ncbi:MAG: DUF5752 family protein [Candidatus Omnitrophota bacterium]|jgi:hypothetical protein